MSYEERIARTEAKGNLSPEQANTVRETMANFDNVADSDKESHKKMPIALFIGLSAILIIGLALFFGGGNGAEEQIIQDVSKTLNQPGGVGVMNKNVVVGISVLVLVVPVILLFMLLYNNLVSKEEEVMESWAQVETLYQRRVDLIPNLVETVKQFAIHEHELLTAVTESRAKVMSLKTELNDQASLNSLSEAQAALGLNVSKLMAVAENYPQIRSSQNFLALQDQIEGTENRINMSRMLFNETVGNFNTAIRKMPGALIAGLGNFQRKAYFKSEPGSEKAVKVNFAE